MQTNSHLKTGFKNMDHPSYGNAGQHTRKGFLGSKCSFLLILIAFLIVIIKDVSLIFWLSVTLSKYNDELTGVSIGCLLLNCVAKLSSGFLILYGIEKFKPNLLTISLYVLPFILLSRFIEIILHAVAIDNSKEWWDMFDDLSYEQKKLIDEKETENFLLWTLHLTCVAQAVLSFVFEIILITFTCFSVSSFQSYHNGQSQENEIGHPMTLRNHSVQPTTAY